MRANNARKAGNKTFAVRLSAKSAPVASTLSTKAIHTATIVLLGGTVLVQDPPIALSARRGGLHLRLDLWSAARAKMENVRQTKKPMHMNVITVLRVFSAAEIQ